MKKLSTVQLSLLTLLLLCTITSPVLGQNETQTSPSPSLEPEQVIKTYRVYVQILEENRTVRQADVIIDDDDVASTFSGLAEFQLAVGAHSVEVLIDGNSVYEGTLVVTKSQTIKIDITPHTSPLSSPSETSTSLTNSDASNGDYIITSTVFLVIALTGVAIAVIIIKRR